MPVLAHAEIARARTIFQAELKAGYRDRVVIGGLSAFAATFRARLADSAANANLQDTAIRIERLLQPYARLSTAARAEALHEALLLLDAGGQESGSTVTGLRHSRSSPQPGGQGSGGKGLAPTEGRALGGAPQPRQHSTPSRPRLTHVASRTPPAGITLDTPLSELKGVGPQRAKLYARLGLRGVRDLLHHFPSRHLSYPPARPIADLFFLAEGSTEGVVEKYEIESLPRGLRKLRAIVRDDTGTVNAVWLRHGIPRLGFQTGERIALSGKLIQTGRQLTFDDPDYEPADSPPVHTRGLVPVYPLTAGLFDKEIRSRIHWTVTHLAEVGPDPLPVSLRAEHQLLSAPEAIRAIHFPGSPEARVAATKRFAFEEHLALQITLLQRRRAWQDGGAPALPTRQAVLDALLENMPFTLTGAQQRVVQEILQDTARSVPMTRLLQGEVGSGKTAVATIALLNAVANGYQGAIMAPTEILAEQHYATISRLFDAAATALEQALGRRPTVQFLSGSVKGKARANVYASAARGEVDILVGTQALIQESFDIDRLGLIVVDEQHRFGVKQRDALRQKAARASHTPHLLVMTATPIPRTLQLSLFGDLDLSTIDELPPGRQPIKTILLGGDERDLAYEKLRRVARQGQQCFIICPLVQESEALEAKAAIEEYERLRSGELSDLRLGLIHGRMKPAEKDATMRAFRDGEFDVLVATAVIEVGVDVPNATVMLIEGAERFGLAQLHQFRGRIGRGDQPSVCMLLTNQPDPSSNERLRIVEQSNNGLELAEHDLRLRGSGEFFGVKQSGFPELKAARLDDLVLAASARSAAQNLLAADPTLEAPEHTPLRAYLDRFAAGFGEPS